MKRYILPVLMICGMCLSSTLVKGQDIHYTLFNDSYLTTNPALTGSFYGSYRIGSIFRDQWYSILPNKNSLRMVSGTTGFTPVNRVRQVSSFNESFLNYRKYGHSITPALRHWSWPLMGRFPTGSWDLIRHQNPSISIPVLPFTENRGLSS